MKIIALGLGLALLVPASLAGAQPQPQGWWRAERPATARELRRGGADVPPAGPACVPWCAWDSNPCDPPEYKKADGRCFQDG